jgi:Stage II sporulation protein E (SpoIIE)
MTSPFGNASAFSCAPDHQSGRIRYRLRDQRRLFRIHPHAPWIALHCGGRRRREGFGYALVMALTRAYVRSFAALALEVDQILTQVNRMLVQDLGDGFFVTLALAHWIYATVPWSTQAPDTSPAILWASRARWSVRGKAPVCLSVFFPRSDILGPALVSYTQDRQSSSRQKELPNRIGLAGTSREPDAR